MELDMNHMNSRPAPSDALVLFGVTGDLAHKQLFPALYSMVKRGVLTVPVIGLAGSRSGVTQLRERVTVSVRRAGMPIILRASRVVLLLLHYVYGDYAVPK